MTSMVDNLKYRSYLRPHDQIEADRPRRHRRLPRHERDPARSTSATRAASSWSPATAPTTPPSASSPTSSSASACRAAARAVVLPAVHRGVAGAARTDADGSLRVEVEERPDVTPPPSRTAELEREYRAVVEEILELRGDDGRVSAFVRSITEPGRARRHLRLLARPHLRAEGRAARRRSTSSSG